MSESATQFLAWFGVGVLALRVEHLIASTVWVFVRGAQFARALNALSPREQQRPTLVAQIFGSTDGGKLPYLFFGVKSYRLEAAASQLRRRGHPALSLLFLFFRGSWRYYTLPLVLAPLLAGISITGYGEAFRLQLLVAALLLLVGFNAIAFESLFAAVTMGSWMTHYHRFPRPPGAGDQPDPKWEATARLGVMICLVLPCIYAAVAVTAAYFDAYSSFPDGSGAKALFVMDQCIDLVGFASAEARTAAGIVTKFVTVATAAVYLLLVVGTLSGLSRPGSHREV